MCFVIFSIVDFDHISCLWVYENACCQIKFVCFNFHNVNLMPLDLETAYYQQSATFFTCHIIYICMCVNQHHICEWMCAWECSIYLCMWVGTPYMCDTINHKIHLFLPYGAELHLWVQTWLHMHIHIPACICTCNHARKDEHGCICTCIDSWMHSYIQACIIVCICTWI